MTGEPLTLHRSDGGALTTLEIERWLQPANQTDAAALEHAVAPVLDIGCGPGRIVEALAHAGLLALGIDISQTAVRLTRGRGLNVLRRDVFGPLPREGSWSTAVLLDGNIGIGGDAGRLLERTRRLLVPGGLAIVETSSDELADEQLTVRFRRGGRPIGPNFPWALVGRRALLRLAEPLGYTVTRSWTSDDRSFTVLTSAGPTPTGPTATGPTATVPTPTVPTATSTAPDRP